MRPDANQVGVKPPRRLANGRRDVLSVDDQRLHLEALLFGFGRNQLPQACELRLRWFVTPGYVEEPGRSAELQHRKSVRDRHAPVRRQIGRHDHPPRVRGARSVRGNDMMGRHTSDVDVRGMQKSPRHGGMTQPA